MSRLTSLGLVVALTASAVLLAGAERAPRAYTGPERMRLAFDGQRAAAEVDERFLSFAVDTAQVVGGKFWAPKGEGSGLLDTHPVDSYDFARPRLRHLAAALAPAYLRIGGTDADRTVYDMSDAPAAPSGGARWVLTRRRWDEVNAFARAVDLRVAFTLNAGPSARDDRGDWNPESARSLIAYSQSQGYPVDVWELGNEVNAFPVHHWKWLSVDRYAGDLARVRGLLAELHVPARLAGPSSAFWPVLGEMRSFSEPLMEKAGGQLDILSWHYYPQQSHRCPVAATRRAKVGRMLSADELADVEKWAARVEQSVRDHNPRATIWLGETGGAQCGGEPGLSDAYADALWWLDEMGRVARRGHAVVVRQTLSGSDYGLVDDRTLEPNPSYWASWLWRSLMGRQALAAQSSPSLRIYAHCARASAPLHRPGAVTALIVNVDPQGPAEIELGPSARVLRLEADGLGARAVRLNGEPLRANTEGDPPALADFVPDPSAKLVLPPLSIAFVLLPEAAAPACGG